MSAAVHAYDCDLAYIHDVGYGAFARGCAPGLLDRLQRAGIRDGLVIDLGCGSGIWAQALVHAGYDVLGVDLSSAMIELARQRVPQAQFQVGSFVTLPFPPCRAVTALGEVFNYLFDPDNSLASVRDVCRRAFDALAPGGLLIFDVAGPDRSQGRSQAFTEGPDWTCLVEYRHDPQRMQLTRRIVTFRRVGQDCYRRREEVHRQQLFAESSVMQMLEDIGFEAEAVKSFGEYPLGQGVVGFVARKPMA